MSRSTRSKKLIKKEVKEEGDSDAYGGAVAPRRAARRGPQTSLLSLPDDLLLEIYQELYEDEYGTRIISPPVSEILINKRVFNLIRPLWFSRLSVNQSQLDLRLPELLTHPHRRQDLRRLQLTPSIEQAHLIRVVLSNLRSLTHLFLNIVNPIGDTARKALVEGIESSVSLAHLELNSKSCALLDLNSLFEVGHTHLGRSLKVLSNSVEDRMRTKYVSTNGLYSLTYGTVADFDTFNWWPVVGSFQKLNYWDYGPAPRNMIASLERGIVQNPNDTVLPLEKLALDVDYRPLRLAPHPDRLSSDDLTKLLHLLSLTRIKRLELNLVTWIPRILSQQQVLTLKLLITSGPCSFANEDNFSAFSNLLLTLPSLTQLHLAGSNFFGNNFSADKISKLEPFQLFSRLPLLAALLACLRTTNVKIFTYRGAGEKREIRWTRSSTQEDFARDCWTLSDQTPSIERVNEGQARAAAALEAGLEHVPPARRPTSLLSLPDDLLLSVYEELYEDQYGDKIISPPILEILVNKRIFNLVRPLWISRLSINSSQLDKRLAELLNDSLRLVSLRRLHLQFHETLAHLIGMTNNFEKLSLVLLNLPSLSQLHLVGSNFFHDNLSADTLSRLEGIQIAFRYPLLGSLLGYLRSSKVKIFTYRGEDEKREMRWTRISTEEDFDRDCWTL
ncbi:hypothetical protein JCM5350_003782 [Sporobolomyces pararoseus]